MKRSLTEHEITTAAKRHAGRIAKHHPELSGAEIARRAVDLAVLDLAKKGSC